MYCSKCGAKLSDDSLFCHVCGSKVIKFDDVRQQTDSTPEYNDILGKASETNGKLVWIKDKLLTIIWVFFFLVAGAIGKIAGKTFFKHVPFLIGLLIGASVVSVIQYFMVKKFGKWEDNDKVAWICTGICFIAHLILGIYLSIPVLVITGFIMLMKW